MDTNTVIEGTVKFRDGKKWKSRWCVVRKLSPVADCLHLQLYRDSKERYKQGQTKASLSLEHFLGIQSGFTLDKESNTLAIICQEVIVVLAFDTREHLMQWQVKISANLGEGDQFLVQISSAPGRAKLSPGPARLLIQEYQFCLTVGVPPRLIAFWQIRQLRRFGVVEGKFCFEGGSRCGRGEGLYVLVSERPEDLARAFYLAADGKLFTRKRAVTRNMSVMDRAKKHHTFRPDSRLSDVSSVDSAPGTKTPSCSCSHSREDLLSWSPHTMAHTDHGDTMSSTDTHRFDLKSLWNSDMAMGRCTSCMSKIGSMSRSSTLTNTPCNRFPAWTMDRPKSCGSAKMSPSVTCSSVSLSSHSSRESSCGGSTDHHHRHSAIDNSMLVCPGNGEMYVSGGSHTPPSRPPKPPHLSFLRLQSAPPLQSPSSPQSLYLSPSPSCCCSHTMSPLPGPYGNYDVPKPLDLARRKLKLDLKESPVKLHMQPSSDEYYDTPRKLKDNLLWGYGNYDVPPPAQPVSPEITNQTRAGTAAKQNPRETLCNDGANGREPILPGATCSDEDVPFQINKVKLTGEGRMPVMSPCGKIIENPEPTYEEKLDRLLENESLIADPCLSSGNYVNVDENENNNLDGDIMTLEITSNTSVDPQQNYSNIGMIQSLENYENFKYFFSDQSERVHADLPERVGETNENKDEKKNDSVEQSEVVCCTSCGHMCTTSPESSNFKSGQSQKNNNCPSELQNRHAELVNHQCVLAKQRGSVSEKQLPNKFLDNKCNSTSCLHEIKRDPIYTQGKYYTSSGSSEGKPPIKCSVSAANSPALKRITRYCSTEQTISSKLQHLCLRKRSNSADSTRLHIDDESVNDTVSTDSRGRTCVLSNPSSTDSLCAVEKLDDAHDKNETKEIIVNKCNLKIPPLVISENSEHCDIPLSNQKAAEKYPDQIGARRSSSVPNKFFSNRDSSSSNDSGVSTGSLSLRHFGTDFLEFEMPLTTSMSSKRHHIAMINNAHFTGNSEAKKLLTKRSKSVDPLRDLTFFFDGEEQLNGKSTSAEAEVPLFLLEHKNKDYLSPRRTTALPDSRSTSSGTSDMSDYIETLSFSSFSSLDAPESFRYGRTSAPTMKPRSGKEYQKIDRYLLDQETK